MELSRYKVKESIYTVIAICAKALRCWRDWDIKSDRENVLRDELGR